MSDFIDHLFSRSFILDSSSQNVRPRLPSLFETPLNEQQKLIMPFAANPEQTNAGRDSTPGDERESVAPAARFLLWSNLSGHLDGRKIHQLRSIT